MDHQGLSAVEIDAVLRELQDRAEHEPVRRTLPRLELSTVVLWRDWPAHTIKVLGRVYPRDHKFTAAQWASLGYPLAAERARW